MKAVDPPIIVEASTSASLEDLWSAITQLSEMTQWYFENIPAFQATVGFKTKFLVSTGEREFTHLWTVTKVEVLKSITYEWKYEEYPGCAFVTFELTSSAEEKSTIKLTNHVTKDFPSSVSEFQRSSCESGWEYFIKQRLVDYLENN